MFHRGICTWSYDNVPCCLKGICWGPIADDTMLTNKTTLSISGRLMQQINAIHKLHYEYVKRFFLPYRRLSSASFESNCTLPFVFNLCNLKSQWERELLTAPSPTWYFYAQRKPLRVLATRISWLFKQYCPKSLWPNTSPPLTWLPFNEVGIHQSINTQALFLTAGRTTAYMELMQQLCQAMLHMWGT